MSIATVVTRGYGSFGSVNYLPTWGYDIGEVATVRTGRTIAGQLYYSTSQAGQAYKSGTINAQDYQSGTRAGEAQ